jgi:CRP/FNR family transcriptional regulator, cyclic AMP receptor protein
MDDISALKQVPLFSYMSEEELMAIHSIMDRDSFAPGEVITREGEPAENFHVVVEGRVQSSILVADGKELVIDEVGPGGFFGELSMLTGEPRSTRVFAVEAVKTLALDRTVFMTHLEQHPDTALDVLKVLGHQLHRTRDLLRQSVSRNVNDLAEEQLSFGERLAETVTSLAGSMPFLMLHAVWFAGWLLWNQSWFPGYHFDPHPHDMLALFTGLEAAILAIFVLSSQNRQDAKSQLIVEVDHQVNTKAEVEIGLVLRRLDDLERCLHHYHNDDGTRRDEADVALGGSTTAMRPTS